MTTQADVTELEIQSLPCDVIIPKQVHAKIFRGGPAPAHPNEVREFVRLNTGRDEIRVGVMLQGGLPSLKRDPTWRAGVLVDLSKRGMQFLFHEQLFPREVLSLGTAGENGASLRHAEVAWCKRLASCCFAVGVRLRQY